MKLTIELVPKTSWYNNLRKVMSAKEWDRIRRKTYAEYNYQCGICGMGNTTLHCHEVWEYDDAKHVQRLVGFIALCKLCHHVKHIGFAGKLASDGKLNYRKVVQHFMKVNNCKYKTFENYREKAFKQWEERSKYKWEINLGEYKNIIQNNDPKF